MWGLTNKHFKSCGLSTCPHLLSHHPHVVALALGLQAQLSNPHHMVNHMSPGVSGGHLSRSMNWESHYTSLNSIVSKKAYISKNHWGNFNFVKEGILSSSLVHIGASSPSERDQIQSNSIKPPLHEFKRKFKMKFTKPPIQKFTQKFKSSQRPQINSKKKHFF